MQTIVEDNILIATFMGWKPSVVEGKGGINLYYFPNDNTGEYNHSCKQIDISAMKYSSSWDWLMAVVEKIETISFTVTIEQGLCIVEGGIRLDVPYYKQVYDETKIKAVYNGVVYFIKWYNQNKS